MKKPIRRAETKPTATRTTNVDISSSFSSKISGIISPKTAYNKTMQAMYGPIFCIVLTILLLPSSKNIPPEIERMAVKNTDKSIKNTIL